MRLDPSAYFLHSLVMAQGNIEHRVEAHEDALTRDALVLYDRLHQLFHRAHVLVGLGEVTGRHEVPRRDYAHPLRPHIGALAMHAVEQSLMHEVPQRLAHRGAAHAVAGHEFGLRWDLCPGREGPGVDLVPAGA